ncbi:MAG: aminomethyltransferase family protein [Caldilineaceae bacterium]
MPLPTPFHPRTAALCQTNEWRSWAGYMAPTTYQHAWEREYWAFRNSAGLLDISPLFKYDIHGPDAERLLNRVMTRDLSKCKVGQVVYSPWCDERGDLIHDGNIVRLSTDHFRVTSADPMLRWFGDCGYGMDVQVADVSEAICGLALQGPNSRKILQLLFTPASDQRPLDQLGYFQVSAGSVGSTSVVITRTGFTGDLGYEIWTENANALTLWDSIMERGEAYGILPAGLGALDMVRVEAGLLLIEVDYISSVHAVIDGQRSSPLEAGLGWAVKWNKGNFVGRKALLKQQEQGPEWALVGLEVDWQTLEDLWQPVDLRPTVVNRGTSRLPVPVFRGGQQVGQATSHLFSPLLKKYIALATLKREHAALDSFVELEMTVEYSRVPAKAKIVALPFFNPERKRS